MRMAVLGSGSGGNATVVQCSGNTILIDAGLSAKQISLRLQSLGIGVDDLDGILLTHEHSDHSKGIKVLLKGRTTPVYANAPTREALQHKLPDVSWKVFQNGAEFDLGCFSVKAFPVPHDAQEPVGYVVESRMGRLGVLTDIGYVTGVVRNALQELDGLFLEANYDMGLLEADLKRPWSIKQRISSRHGHLSNEQAAELYTEIACSKLQSLIVGHLSSDCNTESHVKEAFEQACNTQGKRLPRRLVCATQDKPTEWLSFGGELNKTMMLF